MLSTDFKALLDFLLEFRLVNQHGGMQVLLVRWVFFNCLLTSHEQLTYVITMNFPQRCDNDFSNTDQLICLTECSLYWKEGYSFKFEFQRYILK
jgi:hypothetical protein